MKRILPTAALALAAIVALPSCNSGPKRLSRSWDNHVNQKYVESSWIHGALLQDIFPVYPIVGFFAYVADVVALNPYYFWSRDAWEGNGTAFIYDQPNGALNEVGSWPE